MLYLDDDTVVTNDELMVESFLQTYSQDIILTRHDHPQRLKGKRPWWTATPNTGVVIYRNTQWVKRLLNDMLTNRRCTAFWKTSEKQHDPWSKCHDQCCFAVLTEARQSRVGIVPMRMLQCSTIFRKKNDHLRWAGTCENPLVLHAMSGTTAEKVKQLWTLVQVADRTRGN